MIPAAIPAALVLLSTLCVAQTPADPGPIELLVRGDDMGVAQSINEACLEACKQGIVRSVEVIVPGPWFLDAVRRLKEAPEIDVGVPLCLTSEWEGCKWRPLTHAPSLVDADGYFFPMTSQRKDFPPGTGFLDSRPSIEEVEKERRAQIELAKRHLPKISHVSAHMGAAMSTPEIREVTRRLSREFELRAEAVGLEPARGFTGMTAEERTASLEKLIDGLRPGRGAPSQPIE